MRGDFSRRTFRPSRHYSRVLLQQGRVVVDADWNEQAELQLRLARQMMRDLVGPHGGPADALGFLVEGRDGGEGKLELLVSNGLASADGEVLRSPRGRYYVDGILVEHEHPEGEPLVVATELTVNDNQRQPWLVYLEVWERHVTWLEENATFQERSMREVALGGPDTASRSEVRWSVGTVFLREQTPTTPRTDDAIDEALEALAPRKGALAASLTTEDIGEDDPCRDTAEERYRGPENRLYRVEVHEAEGPGTPNDPGKRPTFKWSRENGSVVYAVDVGSAQTFDGKELVLEVIGLGRDDRYHLRRGNVVELVTAELDEAGSAGPLLEVMAVDDDARTVKLRAFDGVEVALPARRWALLRRWDQPLEPKKDNGGAAELSAGAIAIEEGESFLLEDGIVVRFERPAEGERYGFRPGDYWLIPARTIPGDIEWPRDGKGGIPEAPHGVERRFAPLAVVSGSGQPVKDLRRKFGGLAE
jgi:hypothetical protein